jgi:hypothetical protein
MRGIENQINNLRTLFKQKGYVFYDKGDYNLNIIGIRNVNTPDKFDDEMLVVFKVKEEWQVMSFVISTYPGVYWLNNPMNSGGCAILKEGQYLSTYQIGRHFNVEALIQIGGKVKVYRDNDKNETIKLLESSIIEGYFGINIHPVMDKNNNTIGQDSAGCQVLKNYEDFQILMSLCKKASSLYGNSFTYTLINREELEL